MATLACLAARFVPVFLAIGPLSKQAGGGDPAARLGGWFWIWAVTAIAVLVALLVTIFRRDRTRPSPPRTR